MQSSFCLTIVCAGAALLVTAADTAPKAPASFHELNAKTLDGRLQPLSAYKGKAVLVVNVASECGYTPQYAGLQKLHTDYKAKGLVVLGFPCNDFGGQEPGGPGEIANFCSQNYGVTFPLFEKVRIQGGKPHPVYAFLGAGRELPAWNFHKYLVGKDGKVLGGFPPDVEPDDAKLLEAIQKALKP